jgi:hypothetical protein
VVLGSVAGGLESVAASIFVELEAVIITGADQVQVVLQVMRHRRTDTELQGKMPPPPFELAPEWGTMPLPPPFQLPPADMETTLVNRVTSQQH